MSGVLFVRDGIPQRAYALNRDFNNIASDYRPYTFRRSGRDQVAWEQRHHLGDVANDRIQIENEVACIAVLPDFAIHARFDTYARPRIDLVGHDRAYWAERVEALGAAPLSIFLLQIACGEIVDAGIAQDVGLHIVAVSQFVTALADDYAKLAFKICVRGKPWPANRSAG